MHALESIILTQLAEIFNQLVLRDSMGVQHDSLGVLHAGIVLQSSTIETDLLTELGHSLPVEVGEQVELEDPFSHIWSTHQVDFKELGLEMSLIWSVLLKSFEEEGSGFLDSGVL